MINCNWTSYKVDLMPTNKQTYLFALDHNCIIMFQCVLWRSSHGCFCQIISETNIVRIKHMECYFLLQKQASRYLLTLNSKIKSLWEKWREVYTLISPFKCLLYYCKTVSVCHSSLWPVATKISILMFNQITHHVCKLSKHLCIGASWIFKIY